jgi:hypothetical protein
MRDDSRPADLPHLRSIDPSSFTGQFKPDHDNAPTVQLAAMFRRVGKVAEKFKIRATPEEVGIERACGRGLIPAIDARLTVRPKPPGGFPKPFCQVDRVFKIRDPLKSRISRHYMQIEIATRRRWTEIDLLHGCRAFRQSICQHSADTSRFPGARDLAQLAQLGPRFGYFRGFWLV